MNTLHYRSSYSINNIKNKSENTDIIDIINSNNNLIPIENYKKIQYEMLPMFLQNCMNFVIKHNQDIELKSININEKVSYINLSNTEFLDIEIIVNDRNTNENKVFYKTRMPKLLYDTLFMINGIYYSPVAYVLDKPITLKKSSIKYYGLFNSCSIYTNNNMVTFIGINIPLDLFLNLLLTQCGHREVAVEFSKKYKIKYTDISTERLTTYFNKVFGTTSIENAIKYFDTFILDDYTRELYKASYKNIFKDDYTFTDVVIESFKMLVDRENKDTNLEFINLNNKRILFMEMLLQSVFKKMSTMAIHAYRKICNNNQIKSDPMEIIKNFHNNLYGNYLYDTANLYTGILNHKISMLNPGTENPPSSIALIHDTHFGIFCPITVSSKEPGKTLSIIPNTLVDKFGLFVNI